MNPLLISTILLFLAAPGESVPVVSSLMPPGIKVNSRETWVLRGKNLDRVDRVEIEGSGIHGKVVSQNKCEVRVEVEAEAGARLGYREVRVSGPDGMSNLKLARVDRLSQTLEVEPNDSPREATPLAEGAAGVGVLDDRDLDHFRVIGKRGERVAIDLEARRLGASVEPVVTILTATGQPLTQRRETPGVEGDCRFAFAFPADGAYLIQVRDNLHGGSSGAAYRLRVTAEPYATGLFPLGGPPGDELVVAASGGTLPASRRQVVRLPDNPKAIIEVPPFEDDVLAPGKLEVGDGREQFEPLAQPMTAGVTVNGRLDRPGEVDQFLLIVPRGEPMTLRVIASPLGSWLDAVLTVRDARGTVLAENDDAAGLDPGTDSRLTVPPSSGGAFRVEVADRFARGGPEFAYRLTAGPTAPDFRVTVTTTETEGGDVVLLRPGRATRLSVRLSRVGRTGPLTLRIEGLPAAVLCPAVVVRKFSATGAAKVSELTSATAILSLTVPDGMAPAPGRGRLRVVASAALEDGRMLSREGRFPVVLGPGNSAGTTRPVVRQVTSVPFWVYIGGNRD